MPSFLLQAKCELEGIETLSPKAHNAWQFDVQNDASEVRNGVTVSVEDSFELEGSKGTANFIVRFGKGDQQAYIKFDKLNKKHGDGIIRESQSCQWVTILCMECRGLEPTRAYPGNDFDIKTSGENAKVFTDADFSVERDWAEYDDENDLAVQVSNMEYRVIKE